MNATAAATSDAWARQRGITRASPDGWGCEELPLLDRLIEGFRESHARAAADLEAAVAGFRKAFGRGSDRPRLLKLALAVHMDLMAVRRLEAVLRRLDEERSELLGRARA
jgi:hypothetical protein